MFENHIVIKSRKNIGARGEIVTSEKAGRFQCSYDDMTLDTALMNISKKRKDTI